MEQITIEHNPSTAKLEVMEVYDWPIWQKEISTFAWSYDTNETCYLLAGEVIVTPDGGTPVQLQEGDLVTFPKGMSCTWDVRKAVKKHYSFS